MIFGGSTRSYSDRQRALQWVLPTRLRRYGLRPSGKTKGSTSCYASRQQARKVVSTNVEHCPNRHPQQLCQSAGSICWKYADLAITMLAQTGGLPASTCASHTACLPSLLGASVRAKRPCCARCSDCYRRRAVRSTGTVSASPIPQISSNRRTQPILLRSRACSVLRCETISCWVSRKTEPICRELFTPPCWNRISRRCRTDWTPRSGREVCAFLAVRRNALLLHACLYAIPRCWSSTTCQALLMWRPNIPCGNASLLRKR